MSALLKMDLTAKQEKLINSLYTRQGRKKHDLCICEGLRACSELIKARPDLVNLAVKSEKTEIPAEFADIEFATVPAEKMKKLSSTVTPQGILIVADRPITDNRLPITDRPFTVILDGVADPGNMGTIIRTARAAGLKSIFLTSGCADPYSDKVIRSAMAAQFSMNIYRSGDLAEVICELRKSGTENFWKTDPHKGSSLFETDDLFANTAIIIGGEAAGASDHPGCKSVNIPMPGNYESINAAQAATVFIFEAVRRGVLRS